MLTVAAAEQTKLGKLARSRLEEGPETLRQSLKRDVQVRHIGFDGFNLEQLSDDADDSPKPFIGCEPWQLHKIQDEAVVRGIDQN